MVSSHPAESTFGPVLVSLVLNIVFYGALCTQAFLYFSNSAKHDKLWVRLLVIIILLADAINSGFNIAYTYAALIKQYAQSTAYEKVTWVFATDPALTAIIALCVQSFFASRVAVLLAPGPRRLAVVCAIGVCTIAQLLGGLGTAAAIGANPLFERFLRFRAAAALWLAASAAADLLIAVVFTLHVGKHRYEFAGVGGLTDHISRATVQTGLVLSICAMLQLILYLAHPQGNRLTLALPLSKLHANTLLCALNARAGWGWGAAFDAGSPGVPAAGGTRKSGGTAPGSPLRARARSGSGRSRRGLGLGFGPMGGATSKILRETIMLHPIPAYELGDVGMPRFKLERVTTAEGAEWEREEMEQGEVKDGFAV